MNRATLEKLIHDIGSYITSQDGHQIWLSCNALSDELSNIKPDNISPPEVAVDFIKASKIVQSWAKDIRYAFFSEWGSVSKALREGIESYVEPERPILSSALIRGMLGNEFIDVFGNNFVCDIMTYYNSEREGDIEWKREKLASLWRFFESNRQSISKENPRFSQIIGQISNEFSIRHENKSQKTVTFLEHHTERDYERLLDYLFAAMITSFACHNLLSSIMPKIDSLLHSANS